MDGPPAWREVGLGGRPPSPPSSSSSSSSSEDEGRLALLTREDMDALATPWRYAAAAARLEARLVGSRPRHALPPAAVEAAARAAVDALPVGRRHARCAADAALARVLAAASAVLGTRRRKALARAAREAAIARARRPPSPPPVPPGSDLPRDVLGAILAHLRDPRDVAVAAAACKDWAAVVAGDARLRASFPTSGRAGTEGEPVTEGEPAGRPRLWVL